MIQLFSFILLFFPLLLLPCFTKLNFVGVVVTLFNFYRAEAVADANMAIQLDPSMAKAYLRKG